MRETIAVSTDQAKEHRADRTDDPGELLAADGAPAMAAPVQRPGLALPFFRGNHTHQPSPFFPLLEPFLFQTTHGVALYARQRFHFISKTEDTGNPWSVARCRFQQRPEILILVGNVLSSNS